MYVPGLLRQVFTVREHDCDRSRLDTTQASANQLHSLLPRKARADSIFVL
jgi:hypothetical protein